MGENSAILFPTGQTHTDTVKLVLNSEALTIPIPERWEVLLYPRRHLFLSHIPMDYRLFPNLVLLIPDTMML